MNRNVKRILLLEPEAVLAEITAFRLELLGYAVDFVNTPEAAFKVLRRNAPDIVITDLVLANAANAFGFIEALANDEITADIPVMVLSIDADLDRVSAAHKSGAAEFLVVPFHPEVLEQKVASLLKRPRKDKAEKTKAEAAE